jgi:hypothetical protein
VAAVSGRCRKILGHASVETMQRYAKLSDEAVLREAANGLLCTLQTARGALRNSQHVKHRGPSVAL